MSTTLHDALILLGSAACQTGAAGQNKQHLVTKNTAKLDRETEELHHERVTLEVGKVIQQGRQERGLTQKDLATVSRKTLKLSVFPALRSVIQLLLLCQVLFVLFGCCS